MSTCLNQLYKIAVSQSSPTLFLLLLLLFYNQLSLFVLRAPIKSQLLTGRTMARPVILTMKNAFFQESLSKHHLLRACYLGFH